MNNHREEQPLAAQTGDKTPALFSLRHVKGQPLLSRRSFLECALLLAGTAAVSSRAVKIRTLQSMSPALAHKEPVLALAVNANGRLLASGDKGGTIKLWQLPEGVLLHAWKGHEAPIAALAFPHMADTLWSLDTAHTLKYWHLPDAATIVVPDVVRGSQKQSAVIAVPQAGVWFALPAGERVELRAQATGELLASLAGFDDVISALAATPDGKVLLVGGEHGNLGLWTESQGHRLQTIKVGPAAVSYLAVAADGSQAVSLHADGRLRTWHLPGLRAGIVRESVLNKPFASAIRPQLDFFAVGTEQPPIGLWDMAAAGTMPKLLDGHGAAVRALAITPDGALLISGSDDKTIRLWSLANDKRQRHLVDLASNYKGTEGLSYQGVDVFGRIVSFTLPCGTPLPIGTLCSCNCVPGTLELAHGHDQRFTTHSSCPSVCTCDLVCTCEAVPVGTSEERSFLGGRGNRLIPSQPAPSGRSGGGQICTCNTVKVCVCLAV